MNACLSSSVSPSSVDLAEIDKTMKTLRKQIAQQKKQKQALEQQISTLYGGQEKGIEKEE